MKKLGLLFLAITSMWACSSRLSDEQMGEILLNMVMVDNMSDEQMQSENFLENRLLVDSILYLHEVDRDDFFNTLAYLEGNPRKLHKIYEKLSVEVDSINKKVEARENIQKLIETPIDTKALYSLLEELVSKEATSFDQFYLRNQTILQNRDPKYIKQTILDKYNVSYMRLMYTLEHHHTDSTVFRQLYDALVKK